MKYKILLAVLFSSIFMGCSEEETGVRVLEVIKVTITELNMGWSDDTVLEGDPDPFIRIMIDGSAIGETDYQIGETAPVHFDTQIKLNHEQIFKTIVFEIYDHDNAGDNDWMGSVSWEPIYQQENDDQVVQQTVFGESNTILLEYYWYHE